MLGGLALGVVGMRRHSEHTAHLAADERSLTWALDSPALNRRGSRSPPVWNRDVGGKPSQEAYKRPIIPWKP